MFCCLSLARGEALKGCCLLADWSSWRERVQAGSTVYLAEQLSEQPGHTELREQERWTFLQVELSRMYQGLKLVLIARVGSFVTYGRQAFF